MLGIWYRWRNERGRRLHLSGSGPIKWTAPKIIVRKSRVRKFIDRRMPAASAEFASFDPAISDNAPRIPELFSSVGPPVLILSLGSL